MRLSKVLLSRPSCDPKTLSGSYTSFEPRVGGAVFDLYCVGGVFYVVRDGCVGIYNAAGTGVIRGEAGAKLAAKLMNDFPRPDGYSGLPSTKAQSTA